MKKRYIVSYRGEFYTPVRAQNENEALKQAQQEKVWVAFSELHPDFLEIEKE